MHIQLLTLRLHCGMKLDPRSVKSARGFDQSKRHSIFKGYLWRLVYNSCVVLVVLKLLYSMKNETDGN